MSDEQQDHKSVLEYLLSEEKAEMRIFIERGGHGIGLHEGDFLHKAIKDFMRQEIARIDQDRRTFWFGPEPEKPHMRRGVVSFVKAGDTDLGYLPPSDGADVKTPTD